MIASYGMTWDMIAYLSGLDEFSMMSIMESPENAYSYSDVITFDGGENVTITSAPLIESATIKAPWEA